MMSGSSFDITGEKNNQAFSCEAGNSQRTCLKSVLPVFMLKMPQSSPVKCVRFQVAVPKFSAG